MNVRCDSCKTVYRVDPAKVPAAGVRARCTVCSATILVAADGAGAGAAAAAPVEAAAVPAAPAAPAVEPSKPAAAPPPEPAPAPRLSQPFVPPRASRPAAAPPQRPSAPVFRPTPGKPVQPATPAPATEAPPALAAPAAPTAAGAAKKPINPFLAQDPRQKARRLARALVSDMIVYQPEKRQKALAAGNLKEEFEEEIEKSWQEYVEQVGNEMASTNDFWTEALNDILAGGQKLF